MTMRHWHTSSRVTNNSAQRIQTARPSRLTNVFFSRSRKRDDLPAAGRMTAKRGMANPPLALPQRLQEMLPIYGGHGGLVYVLCHHAHMRVGLLTRPLTPRIH